MICFDTVAQTGGVARTPGSDPLAQAGPSTSSRSHVQRDAAVAARSRAQAVREEEEAFMGGGDDDDDMELDEDLVLEDAGDSEFVPPAEQVAQKWHNS